MLMTVTFRPPSTTGVDDDVTPFIAVSILAIVSIDAMPSPRWSSASTSFDGLYPTPPPSWYTSARIEDVPVTIDAVGTVQALNTVTIRTQVDGRLLRLAFTEGQDVRKGDICVQVFEDLKRETGFVGLEAFYSGCRSGSGTDGRGCRCWFVEDRCHCPAAAQLFEAENLAVRLDHQAQTMQKVRHRKIDLRREVPVRRQSNREIGGPFRNETHCINRRGVD